MRQNMSTGEEVISEFLDAHTGQLEVGVKRRRDWDASLEKCGDDGKEACDIGIKVFLNVAKFRNTHYGSDTERC